jgi:DNA-binding cell septation regulator SpoVG
MGKSIVLDKHETVVDKEDLENLSKLSFSVEKMFILPECGSLQAFCDVSVNNELVIRGVCVSKNKKGLFISMPREQGKDQKWYDQVICKKADTYERIAKVVLGHYNKQKGA